MMFQHTVTWKAEVQLFAAEAKLDLLYFQETDERCYLRIL